MVLEPGHEMASGGKTDNKTHWFCYNSSYYKGMTYGDSEDEVKQQRSRELAAKYMVNYGAHRKGMKPEEVADYYSKWAETGKYEEDLPPNIYRGPAVAADEVAEIFNERREKVKVLDVACGTGYVGEELNQLGFKNIEGLDPSIGMLSQCKTKGIYKKLYREFCNDKTLPIDDSIYDCLVTSGGMGEGHIPCSGLDEMIRIVKPDGVIVIVMRREYLNYVTEYKDRLEPLMLKLEQDSKWEKLGRKIVPKYSFLRDGVMFIYRVKKGAPERVEETTV